MQTRSYRRGIALAWTAVVLIVMIGMVGLSIDWGKVTWNVHQLQNAADAAALAGAQVLNDGVTAVIDKAQDIAWLNEADAQRVVLRDTEQPDGTITDESPYDVLLGLYYPQFRGTALAWKPTKTNANAVKAIARRREGLGEDAPPLGLLFGPIFGTETVAARRSAIAMCIAANGAGLILLAEAPAVVPPYYGRGLVLDASGVSLKVYNGDIHVNCEYEPSIQTHSGAGIQCLGLSTHGTVLNPTGYNFPVTQHAPVMADPLAYVPDLAAMPPLGAALKWNGSEYVPATNAQGKVLDVNSTTISSNEINAYGGPDPNNAGIAMLRLRPGYYPKGFDLQNNGTKLSLAPGVYAIGGKTNPSAGLIANGGIFEAKKVMLYVTHDGNGNWGRILLNGSTAVINITEYVYQDTDPTGYKAYAKAGLAIFQDRRYPAYSSNDKQPFFAGGGQSNFRGTVYLHNNSYTTMPEIKGGAGNIGIQMITDRLYITGTGEVIIDYDGRNKWKPGRCFLVE